MRRRLMVTVLLVVVLVSAGVLSNPLHWPSELLRSWLLRQAPLGSSFTEVQALITKHRWAAHEGWGGESFRKVKGIHCLDVHLGDYHGFPLPLPCSASAMWGFDDEKLVDLRVEKGCEGL